MDGAGIRVVVLAAVGDAEPFGFGVRCAGLVAASARLGARTDLVLLAPDRPQPWAAPPGAAPVPVTGSFTLPVTGEQVRVLVLPNPGQRTDAVPLSGAEVVLAAPDSEPARLAATLRRARAAGALTVCGVDPPRSGEPDLLVDADVVVVNLCGVADPRPADVERLAAHLLGRGPEVVAGYAGPLGTHFSWPEASLWWPAPSAADRADPGPVTDAIAVGLGVALAEGQPTATATRFAAAVSALATRLPGPPRILPSRRQVQLLLDQPWPITVVPVATAGREPPAAAPTAG